MMRIDCDGCEVRGAACGDCVVTVLLGGPPSGIELDDADRAALGVLADSGLVPPLRLAGDMWVQRDSAPPPPEIGHVSRDIGRRGA